MKVAKVFLWAEGGLQIAGAATHSFGWHSPSYDSAMDFINDDEPSYKILSKVSLMRTTTFRLTLHANGRSNSYKLLST